MLLGLLSSADALVQSGKARVAVGAEWAHPELLSDREGPATAVFGMRSSHRVIVRVALTEKQQSALGFPRTVARWPV